MAPGILLSPTSPSSFTTALSIQPPLADPHPSSDQVFLSTLTSSSHSFLQPTPSLHAATLVSAKRYLDPLASSTSEIQEKRQQDARKKRKRGDKDGSAGRVLRMKQVYLDGLGTDQIWEQARRILDASRVEVERCLTDVLRAEGGSLPTTQDKKVKSVRFDVDAVKNGGSSSEAVDEATQSDMDEEMTSDEVPLDESGDLEGMDGNSNGEEDLFDEEDIAEESGLDDEDSPNDQPAEIFVPDRNGLNDGFFSIDDFNRQSEFLEQQDARGDKNDGAASDEEEIDWEADPLTQPVTGNTSKSSKDEEPSTDDGDDEEEDGPTFGNADLNAPDTDESESVMDDVGTMNNTNDILYADFFAPPAQKTTKSTRRRALPKTQPPPPTSPAEVEDDIQRTISAVRRDIFEDDSPSDPEPSSAQPSAKLSTHEKRQQELRAEIRRLEAASVASRSWTLSGEARASDRPLNSLLEEDLEFERAGKPLPVITAQVSEDIETIIKRRIIAREFDGVIRRRPEALVTGAQRRGLFELSDKKPEKSLAEQYEADYLSTTNPSSDKPDPKLAKEHAEISALWTAVSAKLDALSSWHYRPKPPAANINVISDVPAVTIEDARPTATIDTAEESRLAPQEVFKPGAEGPKTEISRGRMPVGREEMSREEKLRRRRREKERIKKSGKGVLVKARDGKVEERKGGKKDERNVMQDLKKGGVRVIGKKGEIRDVEGKSVKDKSTTKAGSTFKL